MSSSTPDFLSHLGRVFTAVLTFLAPAAAIVGASVLEASPAGQHVTSGEWVTAAVAAVLAAAAVGAPARKRARAEAARIV